MPLLSQVSSFINCSNLSSCFQSLYNLFFAILIGASLLYFIYGAFQYLISGGGVFPKESGKKKMRNAIVALIVALIIPVILNMINPNIFKAVLKIPQVSANPPQYIGKFKLEPGYLPGGGTKVELPPEFFEDLKCDPPGKEICKQFIEDYINEKNNNGNSNDDVYLDDLTKEKLALICAYESGGDPTRESEVDKCQDGNAFSIGLFQINMAIRNIDDECRCDKIFDKCADYTCQVKDYNLYQKCKDKLKNPIFNLDLTRMISNEWHDFNPWSTWSGIRDKCF